MLKRIAESTKYVSENSKYVKINYDKLDEVISNMNLSNSSFWLDSNPFNILDMDYREIINFLLILHSIGDYCFWGDPKWTINTSDGELDGSYAMIYLIVDRLKSGKGFDMTFDEFSLFLSANVEMPLLRDRYNNLVVMNNFLKKKESDFYSLIKDYYDDEALFEYLITNLDFLEDTTVYNGREIYFYKRAQLLTSDILHVRKLLEKVDVNYGHLLGCADYKIPQVMRGLGILEYSEELERIIDNKILIPMDSEMEIEIRANDIEVIDYMARKLNNKILRMDINDYIWLLGQDKKKIDKPYHRTITNHY